MLPRHTKRVISRSILPFFRGRYQQTTFIQRSGTKQHLKNWFRHRAAFNPWPKLFQNLRSTRETELADQFPIQVVCDWIGNTEAIASKHYLQVTEDHFARAVEQGAPKEGQKEGQQPAGLPRRGAQPEVAAHKKTPVLQGFAAGCEVVQSGRVEDRGLEPLTFWLPARRSPN